MRDNRSLIKFFIAATFFYWIALYLYVPTLPSYVNTKTVHLASVGLVLSMYGLWQMIIRIPLGVIVDVTGRRTLFITLGLLCTGIGPVIMALGDSALVIGIGRAFTGLGAGTWVPLIAVFSGLFPPKRMVFASSLLVFIGSFGRMLATLSNGFLNNLGGYPLAFYAAATAALISIVIILSARLERHVSNRFSIKAIGKILIRPDFLIPTALSTVAMFGTWAFSFGFLPIRAEQLSAGDIGKSILIAVNIAAVTGGNLLNTKLSKLRRHSCFLFLALFLLAAAMVITALTDTLWVLFFSAVLIGLANGVGYPTYMGLSIRYIHGKERSTATGMHQSLYAIGMFTGPWISGIIADKTGIPLMFLIVAGFCLVGGNVLLLLLIRMQKNHAPHSGTEQA